MKKLLMLEMEDKKFHCLELKSSGYCLGRCKENLRCRSYNSAAASLGSGYSRSGNKASVHDNSFLFIHRLRRGDERLNFRDEKSIPMVEKGRYSSGNGVMCAKR